MWALLLALACSFGTAHADHSEHGCPDTLPHVTGATWGSCAGKTTCYTSCAKPYAGVVKATCSNGQWSVSGGCKLVFTAHHQGCSGLPPAVPGIVWGNRCDGTSYCGANCMNGYQKAYVYSKCVDGQWTQPSGKCVAKITYAYLRCWGPPPAASFAQAWSKDCSGKAWCKVGCGWGAAGQGYKAKCVNGKWEVQGSCVPKKLLSWL